MENFVIVLFKNKKKKKIIKSYSTEKNANLKYNNLINNNIVEFPLLFENSERCDYELALLSKSDSYQIPLFKTDEVGRNVSVFLENNDEFVIKRIDNYKIEELIYDYQEEKRIKFDYFIKKYFPKDNIKLVSTLHNKIIIQNDEIFNLFILKNEEDSERLLQTLESFFKKINRNDIILVRDNSTTQRKWLYDVLEKNGFDRKKLYRQKTTFSRRS